MGRAVFLNRTVSVPIPPDIWYYVKIMQLVQHYGGTPSDWAGQDFEWVNIAFEYLQAMSKGKP